MSERVADGCLLRPESLVYFVPQHSPGQTVGLWSHDTGARDPDNSFLHNLFDCRKHDMTALTTHPYLTSAWLQVPFGARTFLRAAVGRIVNAWKRMGARWEARARESIAIQELRSLNDRELRDMAISRSDIPRIAREANFER